MNDREIIALYFARDQHAIEVCAEQYGRYCHQIAGKILHDPLDCEETVNDTWMQAWNSIPPNRPTALKLYLARITRNLAFSRYRHETAAKRGGCEVEMALEELGECISAKGNVDDELNKAELVASIRGFLEGLPLQRRNIFIRRYFFLEASREIANRYDLRESNVLMILSRTRKSLKAHLTKEGYFI